MSTRSAVGTIDAEGYFRGRYVHSDGYPTGRGPVLTKILARFDGGLAQMIKCITEDHFGWSYLDADYASNSLGEDRADLVSSVGLAYKNHTEQPDEWIKGKLGEPFEGGWIEWGYFFTAPTPEKADDKALVPVSSLLEPAVSNLVVVVFPYEEVARAVVTIPVRELHRVSDDGWAKIEQAGDHARGYGDPVSLDGVPHLAAIGTGA